MSEESLGGPVKLMRRALGVLVLSGLALVLMVANAHAIDTTNRTWRTSSNPLTVTGYGSTGSAYGTWRLVASSGGDKSRVTSNQKLSNADDHKVYVELQSQFRTCPNGNWQTPAAYKVQTAHTTSSNYVQRTAQTNLHPSYNCARARVRVALDIPWRPDVWSGSVTTSQSSY